MKMRKEVICAFTASASHTPLGGEIGVGEQREGGQGGRLASRLKLKALQELAS